MNYVGLCCCCFEPVDVQEAVRFRPGGRIFHQHCVELWPESHYVVKEKKLAANK